MWLQLQIVLHPTTMSTVKATPPSCEQPEGPPPIKRLRELRSRSVQAKSSGRKLQFAAEGKEEKAAESATTSKSPACATVSANSFQEDMKTATAHASRPNFRSSMISKIETPMEEKVAKAVILDSCGMPETVLKTGNWIGRVEVAKLGVARPNRYYHAMDDPALGFCCPIHEDGCKEYRFGFRVRGIGTLLMLSYLDNDIQQIHMQKNFMLLTTAFFECIEQIFRLPRCRLMKIEEGQVVLPPQAGLIIDRMSSFLKLLLPSHGRKVTFNNVGMCAFNYWHSITQYPPALRCVIKAECGELKGEWDEMTTFAMYRCGRIISEYTF